MELISAEEEAERRRKENSKDAPPGWTVWDPTPGLWCARPPGRPNPATYVHGDSRQAVIAMAWETHGGKPS